MQHSAKFQDVALLTLRVIVGAIFLQAGYVKLMFWSGAPESMPMSAEMVDLMKFLSIVESIGAVALLAGFLTRWAAAGLAVIMVGAVFIMQFTMQVGFSTPTGPGWSFPLMILGGCIVLMAFGAGRWAVEGKGGEVVGRVKNSFASLTRSTRHIKSLLAWKQ